MSKLDILTKKYMSDNEHFADAFNFYLFQGRQVVQPTQLHEMDPSELLIHIDDAAENEAALQRSRDKLKNCVIRYDDRATYIILGTENQTNIHYAMPVRIHMYDALEYDKQVSEISRNHRLKKDLRGDEFLSGFSKSDKIRPVITITIYFGLNDWDGPRSLYEMFDDTPPELLKYVNDYKLNLIAPREIKDFSLFKTDLKNVLQVIAYSDSADVLDLIRTDPSYREVAVETVRLINECAKINIPIKEGEVTVDMNKGFEELKQRYYDEGHLEGFSDGRAAGFSDGRAAGFSDGRAAGFSDGRAAGFSDGRAEEISSTITKLLGSGMVPQKIHELLGYPLEEIIKHSQSDNRSVQ